MPGNYVVLRQLNYLFSSWGVVGGLAVGGFNVTGRHHGLLCLQKFTILGFGRKGR